MSRSSPRTSQISFSGSVWARIVCTQLLQHAHAVHTSAFFLRVVPSVTSSSIIRSFSLHVENGPHASLTKPAHLFGDRGTGERAQTLHTPGHAPYSPPCPHVRNGLWNGESPGQYASLDVCRRQAYQTRELRYSSNAMYYAAWEATSQV
jgi:hypothetical protein